MSNTQYSNNSGGGPWPPPGSGYASQQSYQQQQQQVGGMNYTGYSGVPPYAQPVYPMYQPVMVPQQNNDSAVVCLVLGILSIFFSGPIGLVLGIIGMVFAKKALQTPVQSNLTTAGRICSIVGIVLSSLVLVFLVFYVIFIIGLFASLAASHP